MHFNSRQANCRGVEGKQTLPFSFKFGWTRLCCPQGTAPTIIKILYCTSIPNSRYCCLVVKKQMHGRPTLNKFSLGLLILFLTYQTYPKKTPKQTVQMGDTAPNIVLPLARPCLPIYNMCVCHFFKHFIYIPMTFVS